MVKLHEPIIIGDTMGWQPKGYEKSGIFHLEYGKKFYVQNFIKSGEKCQMGIWQYSKPTAEYLHSEIVLLVTDLPPEHFNFLSQGKWIPYTITLQYQCEMFGVTARVIEPIHRRKRSW